MQQMTVVVDGLPEKAGELLANLIWIGELFIMNELCINLCRHVQNSEAL